MYAIKIRKTDMPLLTILNGGVEPTLNDGESRFLIVDPGQSPMTVTVSEKVFDRYYADKVSTAGPALLKINKRATR